MSLAARSLLLSAGTIAVLFGAPAAAEWRPSKPIEFVATAGPGGGTDNLARTVQSIIVKYKLTDQPVVVINKGGGSGAEGYTYAKASAGDPHKVIFGTSNAWQQPMVSRVAFKHTDEVLTRMVEKAANVKLTYIPFKSGAEAAVQLAGGHIDSHVNNPNESLGQWRGGTQRPVCAFSPKRLPQGPKITATEGWSDIPTCVEQGLAISQYEQPRTVWLPGKVSADQTAFYQDLMKKVQATPEWKDYIEKTSQVDTFLTGDAFEKFIKEDLEHLKQVAAEQGWLIK